MPHRPSNRGRHGRLSPRRPRSRPRPEAGATWQQIDRAAQLATKDGIQKGAKDAALLSSPKAADRVRCWLDGSGITAGALFRKTRTRYQKSAPPAPNLHRRDHQGAVPPGRDQGNQRPQTPGRGRPDPRRHRQVPCRYADRRALVLPLYARTLRPRPDGGQNRSGEAPSATARQALISVRPRPAITQPPGG